MDPILRRSSFYYVLALVTYLVGPMGRYMLTRSWPVFEIMPLFLPAWLLGAMLASEHDERYAYLRTLPVPDSRVVRIKFRLILTATAVAWALMIAAGWYRVPEGVAGPSTLVYITLVAALGLLVAGCYQISIWRYGFPAMFVVFGVSITAWVVLALVHVASLSFNDHWPAFSRLGVVEWLAGAPWLSIPVLCGLALLAFRGLMRVGVRVKASSEACL